MWTRVSQFSYPHPLRTTDENVLLTRACASWSKKKIMKLLKLDVYLGLQGGSLLGTVGRWQFNN